MKAIHKTDEEAVVANAILTPEIAEQVVYNIMNTPVRDYPCPHFVVESVWPEEFFDQLVALMPQSSDYEGIVSSGRMVNFGMQSETRFLFSLENHLHKLSGAQHDLWKSVDDFMQSGLFRNAIMKKFMPYIQQRFTPESMGKIQVTGMAELVRDLTDYSISPHSDTAHRLLNLFFYLPENDLTPHLGTSFYVPKDRQKAYSSGKHFHFEDFHRVFTAPYRRNVMAAFFKNDVSFHGVEPVKEKNFERNALSYIMRVYDASGAPFEGR